MDDNQHFFIATYAFSRLTYGNCTLELSGVGSQVLLDDRRLRHNGVAYTGNALGHCQHQQDLLA